MFAFLLYSLLCFLPKDLGHQVVFSLPKEAQNNKKAICYYYNGLIINIPILKPQQNSYPAIIVYGGSDYATAEFMRDKTPEHLRNRAIMVFSPCRDLGGRDAFYIENQLFIFLKQRNLTFSSLSLCGFSRGGPDAMSDQPERYKTIGLIDPIPSTKRKVSYHSNIILSYSRLNWAFSEAYGELVEYKPFEELSKKIYAAGGVVDVHEVKHNIYVTYFFNTFGEKFL